MSSDGLTILAVDDEHTQLEDLARLLRSFTSVHDVECAFGGHDALLKASSQAYDVIFLDVRMPDLDGVELGRVLRRFASPPQLVFVSAHDAAAVDAFELRAVDYLRKPVSRRRLEEALERVAAAVEASEDQLDRNARRPRSQPAGESEMIAVSGARARSTRLINRSSILYVQSHGDFVRIVTEDGRYLLRATLNDVEHRWAPFDFVRVHRQYVANLARAVELRPLFGGTAELGFAGEQSIPVARRHVARSEPATGGLKTSRVSAAQPLGIPAQADAAEALTVHVQGHRQRGQHRAGVACVGLQQERPVVVRGLFQAGGGRADLPPSKNLPGQVDAELHPGGARQRAGLEEEALGAIAGQILGRITGDVLRVHAVVCRRPGVEIERQGERQLRLVREDRVHPLHHRPVHERVIGGVVLRRSRIRTDRPA